MQCVYPTCKGHLQIAGDRSACPTCKEPVIRCQGCGTPNRSAARFCLSCGSVILRADVEQFAFPASVDWLQKPKVITSVRDYFRVAPVAFHNHLYYFSITGQVYRYSPTAPQAVPLSMLGSEVGQSAFIIRELRSQQFEPLRDPWLLVMSRSEIRGCSLADGLTKTIAKVATGFDLVSASGNHYTGIECVADRIHAFARRDNKLYWISAGFPSGQLSTLEMPADEVVGPFKSGSEAFAYSETLLLLYKEAGIQRYPFPSGFHAWVRPGARDLKVPFGHKPLILKESTVYIPGSFNGMPAFLLQRLRGNFSETAIIPIEEEACYAADYEGGLLVSLVGSLVSYSSAAPRQIVADGQLGASRPGFAGPNLNAGFVETAGGERLRLYSGDKKFDHSLASFPGFVDCISLTHIGSALVMTYIKDNEHVGIASWYE